MYDGSLSFSVSLKMNYPFSFNNDVTCNRTYPFHQISCDVIIAIHKVRYRRIV